MRKLRFHPCGNFKERYEQELTVFTTDFGRLWLGVGLFLLFAVVPWVSKPYILYIINHIGIAAIAAIGWLALPGAGDAPAGATATASAHVPGQSGRPKDDD